MENCKFTTRKYNLINQHSSIVARNKAPLDIAATSAFVSSSN